MKPHLYDNFSMAIQQAQYWLMHRSKVVHSAKWQGSDIANRPEMATHEVTHVSFGVDLGKIKVPSTAVGATLGYLREDILPNLPWADNHFEERVCGAPINPGVEWANWPYANSAATFLDERGMFNHNYMERYWPKWAGMVSHSTSDRDDWSEQFKLGTQVRTVGLDLSNPSPHRGILYDYGDLDDVVRLLAGDPYTRQAYLPVWFPEDTGGGSKRAPCTIGYHFMMREDRLDINYHIRSCDFIRHFRDDIYLTIRLQLWVLEQCRKLNAQWDDVTMGRFDMQIGSLHVFRNDYLIMMGR